MVANSRRVRYLLTLEAPNQAPTITSGAEVTVAENSTGIAYTATATDPDGDEVSWSLAGLDQDLFTIDELTGEVTFKESPDYESPQDRDKDNTYELIITATDKEGLNDTKSIIVNVDNINELPTLSLNNTLTSLDENADTGTPIKVANILINDDGVGTNTLSLTGEDAEFFEIVDNNKLYLKAGVSLDVETKSEYNVTVSYQFAF